MLNYKLPKISERAALAPKTAWLVASGDLRQSPNIAGWPTQEKLERSLTSALADLGWSTAPGPSVRPGQRSWVYRQPAHGNVRFRPDTG